MNTNEIKNLLNAHLKNHPDYESWMQFDSVELISGKGLIPRYKSAKSAGASMSEAEARRIHKEVCSDIIKIP